MEVGHCETVAQKIGMDVYDNKSFRPVSNLIFLAKIIEKCMLSQFTPHCTMFGILPAYQSAYRKYHSCETSLLNLTDTILWNMEKTMGYILFCD